MYKVSGLPALMERSMQARGRAIMVIILFHRVTNDIPEDGLTVSLWRFRRICQMLQKNFRVVPLGEVVRLLRSDEPIPPRTLAVTFDDSYLDNLAAAEVLAEFHLPACFFIPTGFIATDRAFDWDRHLPRPLPNLTWEHVSEIADMGFEVGSHTVNHPDLSTLTVDEARKELVSSRKTIEDKLGRPVRWFAYPFGGRDAFRQDQLPLVEEAGYEACFSAFGGFLRRPYNGGVIARESVSYFRSVLNLELYLNGSLHWLYGLKRKVGLQS
jgi:peptidoglycan/xylan/chitin deacetylase (PgdA/CDA1 family)